MQVRLERNGQKPKSADLGFEPRRKSGDSWHPKVAVMGYGLRCRPQYCSWSRSLDRLNLRHTDVQSLINAQLLEIVILHQIKHEVMEVVLHCAKH